MLGSKLRSARTHWWPVNIRGLTLHLAPETLTLRDVWNARYLRSLDSPDVWPNGLSISLKLKYCKVVSISSMLHAKRKSRSEPNLCCAALNMDRDFLKILSLSRMFKDVWRCLSMPEDDYLNLRVPQNLKFSAFQKAVQNPRHCIVRDNVRHASVPQSKFLFQVYELQAQNSNGSTRNQSCSCYTLLHSAPCCMMAKSCPAFHHSRASWHFESSEISGSK